jgi:hypothetical protein
MKAGAQTGIAANDALVQAELLRWRFDTESLDLHHPVPSLLSLARSGLRQLSTRFRLKRSPSSDSAAQLPFVALKVVMHNSHCLEFSHHHSFPVETACSCPNTDLPPNQADERNVHAGRQRISMELHQLICRMVAENPSWSAPRVDGDLVMLGSMFRNVELCIVKIAICLQPMEMKGGSVA